MVEDNLPPEGHPRSPGTEWTREQLQALADALAPDGYRFELGESVIFRDPRRWDFSAYDSANNCVRQEYCAEAGELQRVMNEAAQLLLRNQETSP
jgi:hypothetical protein